MTSKQLKGMKALIDGGSMVKTTSHKYTVRDARVNPVVRVGLDGFIQLKKYCKLVKNQYILSPTLVLQLRKNHKVKVLYKEARENRKPKQVPCTTCEVSILKYSIQHNEKKGNRRGHNARTQKASGLSGSGNNRD